MQSSRHRSIRAWWLCGVALPALQAQGEVLERSVVINGDRVHYKLVLPDDYDQDQAYPAVLVFGGGPQTMQTVDSVIERSFREQAESRGFIVVAPAASDGNLFFRDGERIFPAFLDAILAELPVSDDKFHVAGPSNGGIAAFHIAARLPQYFVSVTAFPGYLWQPTNAKLDALSGLCVFAYIGENDEYPWHEEMLREVEYLKSNGTFAQYSLEAGQPHRLATLAGGGAARLFDNFARAERGCDL